MQKEAKNKLFCVSDARGQQETITAAAVAIIRVAATITDVAAVAILQQLLILLPFPHLLLQHPTVLKNITTLASECS